MYDDLCQAIIEAYPAVNWFAMREAIDLAGRMAQVVRKYSDDKDGSRKALIQVGKDAANFLRQHKQSEVPGAAESLLTCLTAIEMEE
jgi:hypothetical protein|tara:strand:- start:266 stop:526 length:261 start_codon:yes stop_codon:yes gene_type:complete